MSGTEECEHCSEHSKTSSGKCKPKKLNKRGHIMVTVTIIATLSFQVGNNVPGGYWQDDEIVHNKGDPVPYLPGTLWNTTVYLHRAGEPILSHKDPARYWSFKVSSWTGFVTSLLSSFLQLSDIADGPDDQEDQDDEEDEEDQEDCCSAREHDSRRVRIEARWDIDLSYGSTAVSYFSSQEDIPTPLAIIIGIVVAAIVIVVGRFLRRK